MILPEFPFQFSLNGYDFKKTTPSDVPQIKIWMASPHITDWWTPDTQALSILEQGQMDETHKRCYIVSHGGRSFGFIQCYDPVGDVEYWGENPQSAGTYGLDQFVGDVEMLGFGHGTNFIKAFVAALKEQPDVKRIIVDPAPYNAPAIRSYTQVGFRRERTISTPKGTALLMSMSVRP